MANLRVKKEYLGDKVESKLYIENISETRHLATEVPSNLIENPEECVLNLNKHNAKIEYRGESFDTGLTSKEILSHFSLL